MKKQITSTLTAIAIALLIPMTAFAEQVKLTEGTPVSVSLNQPLSTKTAVEGSRVTFLVTEDVLSSDGKTVLIKADTPASGTITRLDKNGMFGKPGEIGITVDRTKTIDGKSVRLQAALVKEGKGKRGLAIGLAVVSLIILWPLAFFIFKQGEDATIASGTNLDAVVMNDVLVDIPESIKPAENKVTAEAQK